MTTVPMIVFVLANMVVGLCYLTLLFLIRRFLNAFPIIKQSPEIKSIGGIVFWSALTHLFLIVAYFNNSLVIVGLISLSITAILCVYAVTVFWRNRKAVTSVLEEIRSAGT